MANENRNENEVKRQSFTRDVFVPFMRSKQHWVFTVVAAFVLAAVIASAFCAIQIDLVERHQYNRILWQLKGAEEAVAYYDEQASQQEGRYARHYNNIAKAAVEAYDENAGVVKKSFSAALYNVDEAYLIDADGKILAADGARTQEEMPKILQKFDGDGKFVVSPEEKIRALFQADIMGEESYFHATAEDGTQIVFIKKNDDINTMLQQYSLADYIKKATGTAGMHVGIVIGDDDLFYVDPDDGTLVETSCREAFPDYENVQEYHSDWHAFIGSDHFIGKAVVEDADIPVSIICAVEHREIYYRAWTNAGLVGATALILLIMLLTYTYYRAEEQVLLEKKKEEQVFSTDPRENRVISRKARSKKKKERSPVYALIVLSVLLILLIAADVERFYSAALDTTTADETVSYVRELKAGAASNYANLQADIYGEYVEKATILSTYVSMNEGFADADSMQTLAESSKLSYMAVFDEKGHEEVSTGIRNDVDLTRENVTDSNGQQVNVLQYINSGAAYAIGQTEADQLTGDYYITVTMPIHDAKGSLTGFLQIAGDSQGLKATSDASEMRDIYDYVARIRECVIYTVDATSHVVTYTSDENAEGRVATEYGFTEADLDGNICRKATIGGTRYFMLGTQLDENTLLFICEDEDLLQSVWVVNLLVLTGIVVLIFAVSAFIFTKRYTSPRMQFYHLQGDEIDMVSVDVGEGASKRTVAAYERWAHLRHSWKSRSAINKAFMTAGYAALAVAVIGAILLALTGGWGNHMTTRYVLSERWNKGLNIFSLTYVLMFMVAAILAIILMRVVMSYVAGVLSPRGETICRMLENLLTYLAAFAIFFVALYQMGIDTTSLAASVGILALIIGLGARDLMTDFISGAFAIFDGEFQVGDTITVGNTTGTVSDIGIRTTKVVDFNNNVIVINNRSLSNVVNKTRDRSMEYVTLGIENGIPLEKLKEIFERELPKVDDKYDELIKVPRFEGISEVGRYSQTLTFSFLCMEKDRIPVKMRITEELIRIMRENGIQIR